MHLMFLIMLLPVIGIVLFLFLPLREALISYLLLLAVSVFFYRLMLKSMKRKPATGAEAMIGSTAEILTWREDSGTVSFQGAMWRARSAGRARMERGVKVKIVAVEGLTLVVDPLSPSP